jgi:hypothetical protein
MSKKKKRNILFVTFPLELELNRYKLLPKKVCHYIGMLSAIVTMQRYDSIRVFLAMALADYPRKKLPKYQPNMEEICYFTWFLL